MYVSIKKVLIKRFTHNIFPNNINAIVMNKFQFGWEVILSYSENIYFIGTIINFDKKLYFIKHNHINYENDFFDVTLDINFYNAQKISSEIILLGNASEAHKNSFLQFCEKYYPISINYSCLMIERKRCSPITFMNSNTKLRNEIVILNIDETSNVIDMVALSKISDNWYKSINKNFFYKIDANFNFIKQLSHNQLNILQQKIQNFMLEIKQAELLFNDCEMELLIIDQYNINQITPKIEKLNFIELTCSNFIINRNFYNNEQTIVDDIINKSYIFYENDFEPIIDKILDSINKNKILNIINKSKSSFDKFTFNYTFLDYFIGCFLRCNGKIISLVFPMEFCNEQ